MYASCVNQKERKGGGGKEEEEEGEHARILCSLVGLFTAVRRFERDERVARGTHGDCPLVVPSDPPFGSARGKKGRGSRDRSGGAFCTQELPPACFSASPSLSSLIIALST